MQRNKTKKVRHMIRGVKHMFLILFLWWWLYKQQRDTKRRTFQTVAWVSHWSWHSNKYKQYLFSVFGSWKCFSLLITTKEPKVSPIFIFPYCYQRVVVRNEPNLLLKIFCKLHEHFNYLHIIPLTKRTQKLLNVQTLFHLAWSFYMVNLH